MDDVFPSRNLGSPVSEYWGRTVETRIRGAQRARAARGQSLLGLNRYNASTSEEMGDQLVRLTEHLNQVKALGQSISGTDSGSAYNGNFSLSEGWNSVATINMNVPTGKSHGEVIARGMTRIADYGTAGGSGGTFVWPFSPDYDTTSEYGPRTGGAGTFHEGLDFGTGSATAGQPIRAAGGGSVQVAGYHSNFGNYVILHHGTYGSNDLKTLYAHMSTSPLVSVGQSVTAGSSVLGYVGATGGAFGAHLHFETHVCGIGAGITFNTNNNGGYRTAVNPRSFMATYGAGGGSGDNFGDTVSRIIIAGNASVVYASTRAYYHSPNRMYTTSWPLWGYSFDGTGAFQVTLQVFANQAIAASIETQGLVSAFGAFS